MIKKITTVALMATIISTSSAFADKRVYREKSQQDTTWGQTWKDTKDAAWSNGGEYTYSTLNDLINWANAPERNIIIKYVASHKVSIIGTGTLLATIFYSMRWFFSTKGGRLVLEIQSELNTAKEETGDNENKIKNIEKKLSDAKKDEEDSGKKGNGGPGFPLGLGKISLLIPNNMNIPTLNPPLPQTAQFGSSLASSTTVEEEPTVEEQANQNVPDAMDNSQKALLELQKKLLELPKALNKEVMKREEKFDKTWKLMKGYLKEQCRLEGVIAGCNAKSVQLISDFEAATAEKDQLQRKLEEYQKQLEKVREEINNTPPTISNTGASTTSLPGSTTAHSPASTTN